MDNETGKEERDVRGKAGKGTGKVMRDREQKRGTEEQMGDGKWAKEQDKRWGMGTGKGIGKRWERGSGGGKATRGKKWGRGSSKEERDGEKKQEREMGGVNRKKVRWGFRVSLAAHSVNMNSQSVTFFPS